MTAEPTATPDSKLQFDQAEFQQGQAPAGATCSVCQQAIPDSYFEVNGKVACQTCRDNIQQALTGGSGAKRFWKGLLFGVVGGAIGATVWYLVARLTGYEVGLIAVLVGFLVGKGVNMGSESRGGVGYQILAVILTYLSIVSTYVPPIYSGMMEARAEGRAEQAQGAGVPDAAQPAQPVMPPSAAAKVFYLVVACLLAFAAPFLAGLQNIIGILIIGFALYEAWMLNRKLKIEITGPYQVAGGSPPPMPQATA